MNEATIYLSIEQLQETYAAQEDEAWETWLNENTEADEYEAFLARETEYAAQMAWNALGPDQPNTIEANQTWEDFLHEESQRAA